MRNKDQIYKKVVTLGPGASFGEFALMSKNGVRAARITVSEDEHAHLGVLSREDYEKCLYKIDKGRHEYQIEFLRSIPYFS